MKKMMIALMALSVCAAGHSQVYVTSDSGLEKQVVESGFIHSPLPIEKQRSFEGRSADKKVLYEEDMEVSLEMKHSNFPDHRAVGSPDDPDYATYGSCSAAIDMQGRNIEKFNRLAFRVFPDCDGGRVVGLNLSFFNGDVPAKEGYNAPTGAHLIPLVNREWNTIYFEIDEFQRDCMKELRFSTSLKGHDMTAGDSTTFTLTDFKLQQVENPERVAGWEPMKGRTIYSTSGYLPGYQKIAVVGEEDLKTAKKFSLVDKNGVEVYSGKVKKVESTIGKYGVVDFSDFNKEGEYRIRTAAGETEPFRISDNLWDNSQWRVLNYIFCQRCGYTVPGIHSICHDDLMAVHDGKTISFGGGWHDAGDLSQQTLQTGDVMFNLLEAYNTCRESNPVLAGRLLEEARWGLDFILRCRFGDGWHASSMGLVIWTDNIFGSFDDIKSVRTQNNALDNFLYAAYEAYASMSLPDDRGMKEYLVRVAEEDFHFGWDKFTRDGYDNFKFEYEHEHCTSHSQFQATICWAASMLYKLTGKEEYAQRAREAAEYVLSCQRTEPLGDGTKGFFYRDTDRISIVHHIHHSREQVFMQALALLCETQPDNPSYSRWAEAIRLHGEFLKGLMKYTFPYGMVPSGVYYTEEFKDKEGFNALHIFAPDDAAERYTTQVKNGVQIDSDHYVKRFPVWFNIFSGNSVVNLAMGKSAAVCGHFLKDDELMQIAAEQLYWTVGKNPFGQSLIYGEGDNYPSMSSFTSGEITGEMPVGIRTIGEEDVPYWPLVNNACYKEVWVSTAGKWMSLVSEF